MVDSKRYDPTITRFQKHTKSFVSGKTKKGHLNNEEREAGDVPGTQLPGQETTNPNADN